MSPDALTIDQFRVLTAVVDEGSFSGAARRLGRAPSAVTYAVGKLEEQSGVVLFDRSTYRPGLTDAGRALLPRARRILDDLAAYRLQAQDMAEGLEAEISMVVDMLAPITPVIEALSDLRQAFPLVQVRISIEAMQACVEALDHGQASIGVIGRFPGLDRFEQNGGFSCELVAVACATHPLAQATYPLQTDDLQDHVQIVLNSRSSHNDGRDYGVQSSQVWRVTDLETKHALIQAGVGWGSMPLHRVRADLDSGTLRVLRPVRWGGADRLPQMEFVTAWSKDQALGPATRWLLQRLKVEG